MIEERNEEKDRIFNSGKIFGKIETILYGFAHQVMNTSSKDRLKKLEPYLKRAYDLYEKAVVVYDIPIEKTEKIVRFYILAKMKLESIQT